MDAKSVMSGLEGLTEYDWRMYHSDSEVRNIAMASLALLKEQPEIIRCKDCKNACVYDDDEVICTHIDSNGNDKHPDDWFCADGERR